MTTPKQLADAIKAFASNAEHGSVMETPQTAHVSGRFDETTARQIAELASASNQCDVSVTVQDATGTQIAHDDIANRAGQLGSLVLEKHPTGSTFYFLTIDGFTDFLQERQAENARQVLVADSGAPFTTISCQFAPWERTVPDEVAPDPLEHVSPKRYVRDMTDRCPRKIGSDILQTPPAQPDLVFAAWKRAALPRLRDSLSSELLPNDGLVLRGDRAIVIDGTIADGDDALFDLATEAAHWVYVEGTDVEVRHILFTYELARQWPDGVNWADGMRLYAEAALESAGNAYRQHLSETTNETLKALSDLRKSLSDEVSRINQQTRDSVGALWRDFAIAFAAIVAHFAVKDQPNIDPIYSRALLWIAAAYLFVIIVSALWSNDRFKNIARANQQNWRRRLYGFLSDDDYTQLTAEPLDQASAVFSKTSWVVAGVYFATIIGLVAASFFYNTSTKAGSVPSPTPSPVVTKSTLHPNPTATKCHGHVIGKSRQPCR